MLDEHQQAVQELVAQWMRRARADFAVTELIDDQRLAPGLLHFMLNKRLKSVESIACAAPG
jgi:hypothetical protein